MNKTLKIVLISVGFDLLCVFIVSLGFLLRPLNLIQDEFFITLFTIFAATAFFSLLTISLIEGLSLLFDKTAVVHTFLISLFAFSAFCFSRDGIFFYSRLFPELIEHQLLVPIFDSINVLFFMLESVVFYFFFAKVFYLKRIRMENIASVIVMILSFVLYVSLRFIGYQLAGLLLFFALCFVWMVKIIHDGIVFGKTGLAFFISLLIWTLSIAATASNNLSLLKKEFYAGMGLFVFPTIGIGVCFIAVYIEYVLKATRKAYQADSFRNKADALQSSVLRNQVDPHFLFNALNTIKSLYPVDKEKGDRAVDLLSKQLRALVEGKDVLLIPLQKELENIYSYVELENMKTSSSFVVLFDIEVEDFEVPIFGVQTLLENAIRYSRVNEKEDGAISLKSYEEGSNFILEIEDNGVGFDVNAIEGGSTGIRNAKERFEHLLKASFSIESQIGVGTRIKIAIPKNERKGL